MPRNVAGVPIDPTEFNRNDGFSPGNLIVTKVRVWTRRPPSPPPGWSPSPTSPPRRPRPGRRGAGRADGRAAPDLGELDVNPADPADRNVILRPAVNFEEGRRYIVALRDLRTADGTVIPPNPAFRAIRDRVPTANAAWKHAARTSRRCSPRCSGPAWTARTCSWRGTSPSRASGTCRSGCSRSATTPSPVWATPTWLTAR
jgi:hypothetical protein